MNRQINDLETCMASTVYPVDVICYSLPMSTPVAVCRLHRGVICSEAKLALIGVAEVL